MMCPGASALAAWDEAFSAFGAKAKRTLFGAGAAQAGAERGSLPAIDPVVDIYNAISIRYAVPVGGKIWPPTVANRGWPLPAAMSHSIR